MPFDVSEEQNLLTSMLTERDAQISTLTHQLHATSELLHSTQKELQSKSASRKAQREEHSTTIKKLKEEHTEQRRILAKFEQNVKNGGGLRVHEYAALMRSANSNQVESSYVIRLQAQLCRAMHSLGVMESQLALVKENCSSLIKFMKEDLSHMVDDRTRREIELMNGLAKVDNEKRIMAEEMEQKIQEKEELLDQVREEYEELGLEYDENEVKRALEVKYLLEQMEMVKEDKIRLERELLAALLEREEQINRLKVETASLGEKMDVLKAEAEKRDREYNNLQVAEEKAVDEDDEDIGEGNAVDGEEVVADQEADESNGGENNAVAPEQEEVAEVTSQLESTTIDEEDKPDKTSPDDEGDDNEQDDVVEDKEAPESGAALASDEDITTEVETDPIEQESDTKEEEDLGEAVTEDNIDEEKVESDEQAVVPAGDENQEAV